MKTFLIEYPGELTSHTNTHTHTTNPAGIQYIHREKLVDESIFAKGREIIFMHYADVYIIDIWVKSRETSSSAAGSVPLS